MGIRSGPPLERRGVRLAHGRVAPQDFLEELIDFLHQGVMIEVGPVPLEKGELRVVPGADLAAAEDLRNLVNRPRARSEETLHEELR